MWKQKHSLCKTIILYILLIFCVMSILLMSISAIAIRQMRKELIASNQFFLKTCSNRIQEKLLVIDDFLLNTAGNDNNFLNLYHDQTELQTYEIGYELVEKFSYSMYNSYINYAYCVVSERNHLYRSLFTGQVAYQQQEKIKEFIDQQFLDDSGKDTYKTWKPVKIGEDTYIVRAYGSQGNYLIALVDLESFDADFFGDANQNRKLDVGFFLTDGQALCLDESQESFTIEPEKKVQTIEGRLVVADKMEGIDLYLGIMQKNVLLGNNIQIYYILLLTVLCLILIPVTYRLLKKWIVVPVNGILGTIQKIGEGTLSEKMDEKQSFFEFRTIAGTFNTMMTEIYDLKIASMQLEIDKQQAQLQYLQEQLKPHFFLNCLKNVYALAENKKYEMIQEMVTAISYHFRFVMEDSQKLVPIERELRHIENYIKLQNLMGKDSVKLELSMDTKLSDLLLPPLCMQCFVENSTKYGRIPETKLVIRMVIDELQIEEEEYADIIISDNGTGFTEDVLKRLNGTTEGLYTGKSVGISNLKNRLRILYGDQAMLAFYNQSQGAVSELILPVRRVEKEQNTEKESVKTDGSIGD